MIKFILLNSDYLILPSSVEGLPFTVLEAMSQEFHVFVVI